MDEIGSYIKYIIIAGILAFRFFAGSKKKEQLPNKRPKSSKRKGTSTSSTSLEDILSELSGESREPEPVHSPKQRTVRNKIEIEDHQYDFRPEYEHHADTDLDLSEVQSEIRKSQGLGRIQLEEEYGEVDFDARQAIIAETILNRPQY
jgi:hypothetical protein